MSSPDHERAAAALREFLRAVGAPIDRDPELAGTGDLVTKAYMDELLVGYGCDPAQILTERTAANTDGLVLIRDLRTSILCPHHLMPAVGVVHVGYVPGEHVVGFGAIGRLVECFARRLILQEVFGEEIVRALVAHLGAKGAGCVVALTSTCFTERGGQHRGALTVTHSWAGHFENNPTLRMEMLQGLGDPTAARSTGQAD
ncbi:MAG: GTP cyclohydrolase I [Myxococcales bacterium]|nr:GTP cyclohydrolase I [Myxococcales bacterium]